MRPGRGRHGRRGAPRLPSPVIEGNMFRPTRIGRAGALALALLLLPAAAGAADLYVDNTVSASGSGTLASPFATIQEGINAAAPGDTIWIRGDAGGRAYPEDLSLSVPGTAAAPITVRPYPSEKVVLNGSGNTTLRINQDWWVFDGVDLDQNGGAKDAIKVRASHIEIANAEIRNGQREGISVENAAYVTIRDSYIHDFMWISGSTRNDAHCIMVDTSRSPDITDVYVLRNTIERCSGDGTQVFGVTGQDQATYAKNLQFVGNTFRDGTTTAGQTENALDFKAADTVLVQGNTMQGYHNNKTVVIQKGSRNINFTGNVLSDGLSGLEMRQEGGAAFLQTGNRVTGNTVHNMSTYGMRFDGLVDLTLTGNTVADLGDDPFQFESTLGSTVPSVDGAVIKNNLIYNVAGTPKGPDLLANAAVGHNGWFRADAGGLADATDTTGTDPGFVNASAADYRLSAGSPAIDAGEDLGSAFKGSAPDLGAWEYDPGGTDTTPPAAPTGVSVTVH